MLGVSGRQMLLRLSSTPFEETVERVVDTLREGKVVALPTDTLYGLVSTVQASQKLYELKRRSVRKPLGLFVADPLEPFKWSHVTVPSELMQSLLPGPVTLIFEQKPGLLVNFNPGTTKVGFRVPDYALVREVCRRIGGPVAQTSANVSGGESPIEVAEFEELFPQIDLVVDGGRLGESREGSTVVDLSKSSLFYEIVRPGCALEQTERILTASGLQRRKEEK